MNLPFPLIHYYHRNAWINDPNGLIFIDGVYHLFYQLNPSGTRWNSIHWGHSVSGDLKNWSVLPPVLKPEEILGEPFSGTAIQTTDGLYALYTRSLPSGFQEQYLAKYSEKTNSFLDLPKGPHIPNPELKDFRDPCIWNDGEFNCVVSGGNQLLFYRYIRGIDAEKKTESFVGGSWELASTLSLPFEDAIAECPLICSFPLLGGESHDVLIISLNRPETVSSANVLYQIGRLKGASFHPDEPDRWIPLDYGHDFYAPQVWKDTPAGGIVLLGWMNNWAYADRFGSLRWSGAFSVPRKLELVVQDGEAMLLQHPCAPVEESEAAMECIPDNWKWTMNGETAMSARYLWSSKRINRLSLEINDEANRSVCFELIVKDDRINLEIRRSPTVLPLKTGIDRTEVFGRTRSSDVEVMVIVDFCSVELFVDGGRYVITELTPWESDSRTCVTRYCADSKGGVRCALSPISPLVMDFTE